MKAYGLIFALASCLVLLAAGRCPARDFFITTGQARPQGYIMVAKGGAPFTSIQAALDSITDASSSKRYAVLVGPGIYNEQVTMKPYVDIMGAGQGATVITQPGSDGLTFATLLGADNCRLSYLTVRSTGGASLTGAVAIYLVDVDTSLHQVAVEVTAADAVDAIGIRLSTSASPSITQCSITVSGASGQNAALYSHDSSPQLRWVELNASGGDDVYGIFLDNNSSLRGTDLTITVSDGDDYTYGLCALPGSEFDLSRINVTAASDISIVCHGIKADQAGGIIKRADFQVSGASSNCYGLSIHGADAELYHINARLDGSGTMVHGLTTGSLDAAASLRMEHFSFEVAGGTTGRLGITAGTHVTMALAHGTLHLPSSDTTDVQGLASTGTDAIITADNVSVSVPEGTGPYSPIGVRNISQESASFYNCDLEAGGGVLSVFQGSTGETTTTTMVNSRLAGDYTVDNMARCDTYLGSCLLKGDYYVSGGNVYCFNCYDENMAAACH